ncbi:MAG: hypothetical protein NT085_02395 [candidate division SR1 bacterium]|nr:hypothetical protein [candidate division SR1 bacterium]
MDNIREKMPLKALGSDKSNERAISSHYRACVLLDACMYQIGEDVPDRMVALRYCEKYHNSSNMHPVHIFDDKGEEHIVEGRLKILYQDKNSFLDNTVSFFDKIMKQTYITKKEIIQLKRQFDHLKEQDDIYKSLFNKVTNIANRAKGKNEPKILQDVYETFNDVKS